MTTIDIEVKGADKLVANLEKFEKEIRAGMQAAGEEAATEIITTTGLQKYPPATEANRPPTPYYIRNIGTQLKSKNLGNSENYGKQFYIKRGKTTIIGNRASYAKWLTDEKLQAEASAKHGWRKIVEVAKEKLEIITKIYDRWIEKMIRDLGL